jgi:ADP-ribose pyrophosphatase YjhB (NUDIX family)
MKWNPFKRKTAPADVLSTLRAIPSLTQADREFILSGVESIVTCDDFRSYDTEYVMGLAFTADLKNVALLRKKEPVWRAGKMDGLGGRVEEGETPEIAMVREFAEEGGVATNADQWIYFMDKIGERDQAKTGQKESYRVRCYCTVVAELPEEREIEEGFILRATVNSIYPGRSDVIDNIPFTVALAHCVLVGGKPLHTTARYS